jgi:hypothetical protein
VPGDPIWTASPTARSPLQTPGDEETPRISPREPSSPMSATALGVRLITGGDEKVLDQWGKGACRSVSPSSSPSYRALHRLLVESARRRSLIRGWMRAADIVPRADIGSGRRQRWSTSAIPALRPNAVVDHPCRTWLLQGVVQLTWAPTRTPSGPRRHGRRQTVWRPAPVARPEDSGHHRLRLRHGRGKTIPRPIRTSLNRIDDFRAKGR